jgi:hypothetical protein
VVNETGGLIDYCGGVGSRGVDISKYIDPFASCPLPPKKLLDHPRFDAGFPVHEIVFKPEIHFGLGGF